MQFLRKKYIIVIVTVVMSLISFYFDHLIEVESDIKVSKSSNYYDRFLDKDYTNINLLNGNGIFSSYFPLYVEDIKYYNKIVYRDQAEINEINGKADELYEKHAYDEALKYYEMVLAIDPEDIHALNGKGNILFETSESSYYWDAFDNFEKVLNINATDVNALNKTADIYFKRQEYDDAAESYDKLLSIEPTNVNALLNSADSLRYLERYDDAIKQYDKLLDIDPQNKDALHNKGVVLIHLERYDDAIKQYDKILDIDPQNKDALHNKGVALQYLERYDDAIKQYDKILDITSPSLKHIADILDLDINISSSPSVKNDYLDITYRPNPHTIMALHNKGVALQYLERYDDAIKYYNKAISLTDLSYTERFFSDEEELQNYADFYTEASTNKAIVSEIQKIINKKTHNPYYEKNGIGIEYPASWIKEENVSKFNLVTFSSIQNDRSASIGVNKQKILEIISDINPTDILDVYSFALIKYIDEKFEINTINNTKISGIPAYEISFNNNATTVSLLWTLKDNYIYNIIFSVNNKDVSSLSTIKKMINSFIINDTINEPSFYIKLLGDKFTIVK